MIVLAIETATGAESVALVTEKRVLAEVNSEVEFGHSSTLMNNIAKVFKRAGLDISAVDAIAVSAGPGSFTGLRVGFSLAKGLAYAAKKPFYAIPTLDALAYAYAKKGNGILTAAGKNLKNKELLCPLLDARKNEYYFSVYANTEKELFQIITPLSLPLDTLIKTVKKIKGERLVFFGNGTLKGGEELKKNFNNGSLAGTRLNASSVGQLALFKLLKGEKQEFNKALPLYIRKPDAILNKEAGEAVKRKKAEKKCRK